MYINVQKYQKKLYAQVKNHQLKKEEDPDCRLSSVCPGLIPSTRHIGAWNIEVGNIKHYVLNELAQR